MLPPLVTALARHINGRGAGDFREKCLILVKPLKALLESTEPFDCLPADEASRSRDDVLLEKPDQQLRWPNQTTRRNIQCGDEVAPCTVSISGPTVPPLD